MNLKKIKKEWQKKSAPLESTIQINIRKFLESRGILVIKFGNVGLLRDGAYIPTHSAGVSDLLCLTPKGIFIAIEVKRPGGKPTEKQQMFLDAVSMNRGIGICATSVEDVVAQIGDFL